MRKALVMNFPALAAAAVLWAVPAMAAPQNTTSPDNTKQNTTSPDNTKMNARDRAQSEPTADQAKNNTSDRELMRKIRRAVVSDKSISTYGHNVKIIAQNGKVTLKGPVHTADEKQAIESRATEIAGSGNVNNEITVKRDSK
jgi:hyperosmotically inducible periplasmic protein